MRKFEVVIGKDVDIKEFKKAIGFISEDIKSFVVEDGVIKLDVDDDADIEVLKEAIINMSKTYVYNLEEEKELFKNNQAKDNYYNAYNMKEIDILGSGQLAFREKALFLYKFFEKRFNEIAFSADDKNCEERMYPVLLPLDEYKKTGYLKNSPQYAIFCSTLHEDMNVLESAYKNVCNNNWRELIKCPKYALSPSACFHTYIELKDKEVDKGIITFTQSVFRNEGRLNFCEFGRLMDYHVREIVLIGNNEYVTSKRKDILNKVIEFMRELNLSGDVSIASDPFIIPKMQKFKKIQIIESSKYEVHLNYEKDKKLSVASLNLHGTAFTFPFNIKVKGCRDSVTGCVGFGLERWVLAFLNQYGEKVENWPKVIREEYKNGKN